jgi:hypothetical protein
MDAIMYLEPGTTFANRYVIVDIKGQGGMAVIYRAMDLHSHQQVAIKHLLFDPAATPEERETRIQRFDSEARLLQLLDHPYILKLLDYSPEQHYMVLELLEGLDFKTHVMTYELSPRAILILLGQLAEALEEVHTRGIVHCDLKPDNVIIENNKVKLLDFGIARLPGGDSHASRHALVGTMEYMAPEQIQNNRSAFPQSDIFSFGVLMYELFTGQLPFAADNPAMATYAILNQDPVPPYELLPQLGTDLSHLILTCLQKTPQHRFFSCRQLQPLLRLLAERVFTGEGYQAQTSLLPRVRHFEDFGLETLVKTLLEEEQTGQCLLWNSFQEGGLWIGLGRILRVDLKGKQLEPETMLQDLMAWDSGNLLFVPRDTASGVWNPVSNAQIESAHHYRQAFSQLWMDYQDADLPEVIMRPQRTDTLSVVALQLLESIDGSLCVGQLHSVLAFDRLTLLQALKELEDRQMLFIERVR